MSRFKRKAVCKDCQETKKTSVNGLCQCCTLERRNGTHKTKCDLVGAWGHMDVTVSRVQKVLSVKRADEFQERASQCTDWDDLMLIVREYVDVKVSKFGKYHSEEMQLRNKLTKEERKEKDEKEVSI